MLSPRDNPGVICVHQSFSITFSIQMSWKRVEWEVGLVIRGMEDRRGGSYPGEGWDLEGDCS